MTILFSNDKISILAIIDDCLKCICNEKLKKFFFEIWKEIGSIDLKKNFLLVKPL